MLLAACLVALLPAQESQVSFLTERQVLMLDRTQVVHFEVSTPSDQDRTLATVSLDTERVGVARTAEVLAGEIRGTLRLAGLAEGATSIRVAGAELEVEVKPVRNAADQNRSEIHIVSPSSSRMHEQRLARVKM